VRICNYCGEEFSGVHVCDGVKPMNPEKEAREEAEEIVKTELNYWFQGDQETPQLLCKDLTDKFTKALSSRDERIRELEAEIENLREREVALYEGCFDENGNLRTQELEKKWVFYLKKLQAKAEKMEEALTLIATEERRDGTYNRSREACETLAKQALAEWRGGKREN